MKNALIINAHQEYPFAKGELNQEIARRIGEYLKSVGNEIKTTTMKVDWDVDEEAENILTDAGYSSGDNYADM